MARKRTKDIEGGNIITFRTRDEEDPAILKWLNMQGTVSDAFRYLMEEEIKLNGFRKLSNIIPKDRPNLIQDKLLGEILKKIELT